MKSELYACVEKAQLARLEADDLAKRALSPPSARAGFHRTATSPPMASQVPSPKWCPVALQAKYEQSAHLTAADQNTNQTIAVYKKFREQSSKVDTDFESRPLKKESTSEKLTGPSERRARMHQDEPRLLSPQPVRHVSNELFNSNIEV